MMFIHMWLPFFSSCLQLLFPFFLSTFWTGEDFLTQKCPSHNIFKPEDWGTSSWSMRADSLTLHCSTLPWALLTGRRSNISFEWDIQEIWDFFHSGIRVSLLFPLHISAWKLQPNSWCWSLILLHRGSFMKSFIHLKGQGEAFFFLFFFSCSCSPWTSCIAHILLQDF